MFGKELGDKVKHVIIPYLNKHTTQILVRGTDLNHCIFMVIKISEDLCLRK